MQNFRVSEREIWPGCGEVRVEGEFDLAAVRRVELALGRAGSTHEHILVDLSACECIDAQGLAVIVRANRRLGRSGAQLLLCGVHGQVERLLLLTGLTENGLLLAERREQPGQTESSTIDPGAGREGDEEGSSSARCPPHRLAA